MNTTHPDILNTERQGMPEDTAWCAQCEHCDATIADKEKVWECAQCRKQICPKCAHVTNEYSERFCTEAITEFSTVEEKRYPSDCLEVWFEKKLAEEENKVFELTHHHYKEQLDAAEARLSMAAERIAALELHAKKLASDIRESHVA